MKFRNKFFISKKNRIGVIILSIIAFITILFPRIFIYLLEDKNEFSVLSTNTEIWNFKQKKIEKKYFDSYKINRKSKFKSPISKFDPNNYSRKEWLSLGLTSKQVDVILKFSKRGLKSNEDLKRIFVISDELFELIKDSTYYPEQFEDVKIENVKLNTNILKIVELNLATEEELMTVKGIGSFFAKQIIKKRTELGGFVIKEQLLEVWKMDQEKYDIIKDFIEIDSKRIIKISINNASVEDLKKHPYIRWNIANSIVKMREQKNGFKSIDEIKESILITNEKFEKLKPYISL